MIKYAVATLLILTSINLMASSCFHQFVRNEDIGEKFERAKKQSDLIFTGTVSLVSKETIHAAGDEEYLSRVTASFNGIKYFKGEAGTKINVIGGGKCTCKYNFYPGVEYLVFASKTQDGYKTYFCEFIAPKERSLISEFENKES
jgi:hypothetical protein